MGWSRPESGRRFLLALLALLATACARYTTPSVAPNPDVTVTLPPPPATATPTPGTADATRPPPPATATATPPSEISNGLSSARFTIWVDPALPWQPAWPPAVKRVEQVEEADLRLVPGIAAPVAHWIYALVAPFPEIRDEATLAELQERWLGQASGQLGQTRLLLSPQTLALFAALWGDPAGGAVEVLPAEELLESAWSKRPAWAIIPFEEVQPRWKVLAVDGQSPLRKQFQEAGYPLSLPISLAGEERLVELFLSEYGPGSVTAIFPAGNRDTDKLTTVVLTGVTALVRATAWSMEAYGLTYPAQDIGPWLREADITHISNEVPFAENCPYPNSQQEGVVFCSDPRYIELLEDVGTDVVELTGDHFHDWGAEAMLLTLGMYRERGWLTYGGGANYDEGRRPALLEHNGNQFAFIGCNGKGGSFARASASSPGSVACDIPWMQDEIRRLRDEGVLVIASFQHIEHYGYAAPAAMKPDFLALAEAGAVIVSGSQAHFPHGFEFRNGAFIHYGLGNLFFDQYGISEGTRQGFVDRHVFYDGRFLGVELLTLQFVDFARSRPMMPAERERLLRNTFVASGW